MNLTPTEVKALQAGTLFQGITIDPLLPRLSQCERRPLDVGEVLLAPGDENRHIYIVLEGELQVQIDRICAPVHANLLPGDCAGEVSLIDGLPVSAWVKAAVPTRVLVVPNEVLWNLVDQSSSMARNLLTVLTGRMRRSNLTIVTAQEGKLGADDMLGLDRLTGVFNRRLFFVKAPRLLKRAARENLPMAGLVIRLQPVVYDHMTSTDRALAFKAEAVAVAGRLGSGLRPGDIAGRIGELDFAVLLVGADGTSASALAERVVAHICASPVVIANESVIPSVICATLPFQPPESAERLFKRVVAALDEAPLRSPEPA
jgi:diguanylate cyclase (GGDEF)-like protein